MNIVKLYIGLTKKFHVEAFMSLDGAIKYKTVYAMNEKEAKDAVRKAYPNAIDIFAFRIQEKNLLKQIACKHSHSRMLRSQIIDAGRAKMYYCICLDCGKEYTEIQ